MTPEAVQAYVSVAALLVAVIGLPIVVVQLRELQRAVRSQAHAAIYEHAVEVRSHLVEYPALRRFFFDCAEIPPDHPEYERALTIAELYLNYLEHIAVTIDSLGRPNRAALERFVHTALARGPLLRRRLEENPDAYSYALLELASIESH